MKHLLFTLLAGLLLIGAASADTNKKCPVSGKDVDAAQTTTVKVTVGFCCAKCQGKFEGDAKMKEDAIQKYAGSKDSPANKKCFVSNKDLGEGNTATAEKTVAFCCPKCKAAFEADPKKYISKVK
jgi:YHS domain-containing protein